MPEKSRVIVFICVFIPYCVSIMISGGKLYPRCDVTRKAKPRGRPCLPNWKWAKECIFPHDRHIGFRIVVAEAKDRAAVCDNDAKSVAACQFIANSAYKTVTVNKKRWSDSTLFHERRTISAFYAPKELRCHRLNTKWVLKKRGLMRFHDWNFLIKVQLRNLTLNYQTFSGSWALFYILYLFNCFEGETVLRKRIKKEHFYNSFRESKSKISMNYRKN